MARLTNLRDERGAVYVEFLIAFPPLFLLFLALCQLALIAAAEAVVRHSAYAAVRAAIVVLEDSPDKFGGAERGCLSGGDASQVKTINDVIPMLGLTKGPAIDGRSFNWLFLEKFVLPQHGARMAPIRIAALLPLLPLAPNEPMGQTRGDSVAKALAATSEQQLAYALEYTKAATLVNLQDSADGVIFAAEPIGAKAPVTARVTYLLHCTVPVVRALMCRPITPWLLETVFQRMRPFVGPDDRYKRLTAMATLPNQGASYYARDK